MVVNEKFKMHRAGLSLMLQGLPTNLGAYHVLGSNMIIKFIKLKNNNPVGKEIHLKKYPSGFVTEDNFEPVQVNIAQLKEGEFLVHDLWMSADHHMRIFMGSETGVRPVFQLNKIIHLSDKFNVKDYF
jgi:hypothetical protein